jgi:hypothetical protein
VLDLTVPDACAGGVPRELMAALQDLPRLHHLHLVASHQPDALAGGLSALTGLRTLSLNWHGPPALPEGLLQQLHEALGPHCRVQLWEQVVLPERPGSFGHAGGDAAGGGGGGGIVAAAAAPGGVAVEATEAVASPGVKRRGGGSGWWRRLLPIAGFFSVLSGCVVLRRSQQQKKRGRRQRQEGKEGR